MAFTFHPGPSSKWSVKLRDSGEAVAALQVNFSALIVDGVFGEQTAAAVRTFQKNQHLTVDGVAGPTTLRHLCLQRSLAAEIKFNLPARILEGILENESGCIVWAFTEHPSDDGFDLGPYQDSIVVGQFTQARFKRAYTIRLLAEETAEKLRVVFDRFVSFGVVSRSRAWQLAVLYHNWPAAAARLARGLSIFVDPSRDDTPVEWVEIASGGRLHTPREWVESYIEKSTKYVRL